MARKLSVNCHLPRAIVALASALVLFSLSSCAPAAKPEIIPSGFLSDYSKLHPCPSAPTALIYSEQRHRLAPYTMIMLDRVQIGAPEGSPGRRIPPNQLADLASAFYGKLQSAVENSYIVVDRPGFGVARLRVAITEVVPGQTLFPTSGRLLDAPLELGGIEAELVDSQSGKQLLALADTRYGEECDPGIGISKNDTAEDCLRTWARLLIDGIGEARGLHRSDTFPLTGAPLD